MKTGEVVGYSVYINTAYYETYESLVRAEEEASRFNRFNDVDVLPMWRFN